MSQESPIFREEIRIEPEIKIIKNISMSDITNIVNMKLLGMGSFQEYDPVEKCITFKLNE